MFFDRSIDGFVSFSTIFHDIFTFELQLRFKLEPKVILSYSAFIEVIEKSIVIGISSSSSKPATEEGAPRETRRSLNRIIYSTAENK